MSGPDKVEFEFSTIKNVDRYLKCRIAGTAEERSTIWRTLSIEEKEVVMQKLGRVRGDYD